MASVDPTKQNTNRIEYTYNTSLNSVVTHTHSKDRLQIYKSTCAVWLDSIMRVVKVVFGCVKFVKLAHRLDFG